MCLCIVFYVLPGDTEPELRELKLLCLRNAVSIDTAGRTDDRCQLLPVACWLCWLIWPRLTSLIKAAEIIATLYVGIDVDIYAVAYGLGAICSLGLGQQA